jgi:hypothetical protein
MATAVISLASSVIGGLLVLAGQWLTRRSEDRRYWRGLLRDAAVDHKSAEWDTTSRNYGRRTRAARKTGRQREGAFAKPSRRSTRPCGKRYSVEGADTGAD